MLAAALLSIALFAGSSALPQDADPELVAEWKGGSITTQEFNLFLGRHAHLRDTGQEALAHILQLRLVQFEAAAAGLAVSPAAVDARIAEARSQIEAAGQDLEAILASRQMGMEEFRRLIGDSLLHEMLVRRAEGLPEDAVVSAEMQQAWSEARITALLELASQAPAGMALDAAPYHISLEELGITVRRIMGDRDLEDRLEQMVLERALPQWARERRLTLNDAVLHAEIEWRRKRVEQNPAYGGVTYEDLLQSRGSSLESVLQSEELQVAGYLRLLAEERYPDTWFAALSEEKRMELESRFGPTRRVSWLLLRAVEEKADELDLDFEDAAEELKLLSERMRNAEDFASIAKDYSQDEGSRRRDGRLGRIHRVEEGVPQALCDAVFAVSEPGIYGPIRIEDPNPFAPISGMALILVDAFEAIPESAAFRDLVRRGMHRDLRKDFLREIEFQQS